ncbi:MAG: PstS family phosphate ABC transporter substrate-binding protein [Oligoflexia bacterium]|nr:PstS family phosphate ABC transporter substrate-binding protein [Oligoflexia bacterium]
MRSTRAVIHGITSATILSAGVAMAAVPTGLNGTIKVDGSSTVYPITEAVAEEFGRHAQAVKVTVGISGTGGGFKKFCAGETDISDASRPIKGAEIDLCRQHGVEYVELPIAYDALSIVVSKKNTWLHSITVTELKKLWEPQAQGKVSTWNQIRPEWPNQPIHLFGPGVDSGTFDYFTEAIVGKEDASRGDYTSSEDDNVLVQGVSQDEGALGFFGFAYYQENKERLRALAIDDEIDNDGKGAVEPNSQTVLNETYKPLARPLFVYVRTEALGRPEVDKFVSYYLAQGRTLVSEVGYVPLAEGIQALAVRRFEKRIAGSVYTNVDNKASLSLDKLLTSQTGSESKG